MMNKKQNEQIKNVEELKLPKNLNDKMYHEDNTFEENTHEVNTPIMNNQSYLYAHSAISNRNMNNAENVCFGALSQKCIIPAFKEYLKHLDFNYSNNVLTIGECIGFNTGSNILFKKVLSHTEALELLQFLFTENYYEDSSQIISIGNTGSILKILNKKFEVVNINFNKDMYCGTVALSEENGTVTYYKGSSISLYYTLEKFNALKNNK